MQYLSGQEASWFSMIYPCLLGLWTVPTQSRADLHGLHNLHQTLKITKHLPVGLKCANQGLRTEDPSVILFP